MALHEWDTLLPSNTNLITPEGILTNFPGGMDIIIANMPNTPKTKSTHPIIHHHEKIFHHIVRLIYFLYNAQPTGIAYIFANTQSAK
jgi:hypothetical protein